MSTFNIKNYFSPNDFKYCLNEHNLRITSLSRDLFNVLRDQFQNMDYNFSIENEIVTMTSNNPSNPHQDKINDLARKIGRWRKGPFKIDHLFIDSEWRSDLKLKRFFPYIGNIENKSVLDIGTNNGYFLFHFAPLRPKFLLGIDPVEECYMQFNFINHFAKLAIDYLMIGIKEVVQLRYKFDLILHMGILYHHRNSLEQLEKLKLLLSDNGQIILETIGLPGDHQQILTPHSRYAGMKNVFELPTLPSLLTLIEKAGLKAQVLSTVWEKQHEQRSTEWSPHSVYEKSMNFKLGKTIEGHPGPERFCLKLTHGRTLNY